MQTVTSDQDKVGTARTDEQPGKLPALKISGLAGWTRVRTIFGDVPASLLRARDLLLTADGQRIELKSVRRVALDMEFLRYHPDARPVRIPAGMLSPYHPLGEAVFAPDQPIFVETNGGGGFAPARSLIGQNEIDWAHADNVVFHQIDCGQEADLLSEGLRIRV